MRTGVWEIASTVLFGLVISVAQPALAQGRSARARALSLFEEGVALYDEGEFEQAAALFHRANELYPEPVLIYNYARAKESLGSLEEARDAYLEYLASDPEDRGAIETRISVLEERIANERALTERAEREAERAEQERRRAEAAARRAAEAERTSVAGPLVLGGVGVATLGGGLASALIGAGHTRDANDPERSLVDAMDLHDRGVLANRLGLALASIGGALIVAGVVWLLSL